MKNADQLAKEFFDSLSDDEFIHVLEDAGFEVERGKGEVIFTDEFVHTGTMTGKIQMTFKPSDTFDDGKRKGYVVSFPEVC